MNHFQRATIMTSLTTYMEAPPPLFFHPNRRRLLHARSGSIDHSPHRRRSMYCCSSGAVEKKKKKTESGVAAAVAHSDQIPVRVVAVVGEGSVSPLKSTPWYDVMLHTAKRLKWVDEGYEMVVYSDCACRATIKNAAMDKLQHDVNQLLIKNQ